VTGPTGATGATGRQGAIGATGAQGSGGVSANTWSPFRDFWFDSNRSDLSSADSGKISDIANYLNNNPSQQVGIDGLLDPSNPELSNRRVGTVRNALLQAGVPAYKIQTGAFGDPSQRRDRKVEVLVSTR
jgi:outer membrane protein OmpA-like peptidoglycan-associated protein